MLVLIVKPSFIVLHPHHTTHQSTNSSKAFPTNDILWFEDPQRIFINSKLTLSLSRSRMGPPGELCQGRQRPSSMAMAPLFLLHHFPAVSFALNVLCMALALWFQGFGLVSPNCDCAGHGGCHAHYGGCGAPGWCCIFQCCHVKTIYEDTRLTTPSKNGGAGHRERRLTRDLDTNK